MSADPFILLPIGIAILLTGVLAVVSWLFSLRSGQDVTERLETYAYIPESAPRREGKHIRSRVVRMRLRLNSMLSMFASEELSMRLASANWPITETEYILIRIWTAVFGFVLGWIISRSILPGIGPEAAFILKNHAGVPPDFVLHMATLGGARALGYGDRFGSIAAGKSRSILAVTVAEQTARGNLAETVIHHGHKGEWRWANPPRDY